MAKFIELRERYTKSKITINTDYIVSVTGDSGGYAEIKTPEIDYEYDAGDARAFKYSKYTFEESYEQVKEMLNETKGN